MAPHHKLHVYFFLPMKRVFTKAISLFFNFKQCLDGLVFVLFHIIANNMKKEKIGFHLMSTLFFVCFYEVGSGIWHLLPFSDIPQTNLTELAKGAGFRP